MYLRLSVPVGIKNYCYSITKRFDGDRFKLLLDIRNKTEYLFNLEQDSSESINIIDTHPDIYKGLKTELTQAIKRNESKYIDYLYEKKS